MSTRIRAITAKIDGTEIVVYNPMTGRYTTVPKDGEFPLQNWGGFPGTWYPRPTHWSPIDTAPIEDPH